MQETRVQSLGWEVPLEKEMATHSSTLAWRIPKTEKPGRLQSMGSQRVRHDWATNTQVTKSNIGLFQVVLVVKNPLASGGDIETWVWFLGWEDPLEEGMETYSSILAWRNPQTEEPVGYSPWGCKESDMTEYVCTHEPQFEEQKFSGLNWSKSLRKRKKLGMMTQICLVWAIEYVIMISEIMIHMYQLL